MVLPDSTELELPDGATGLDAARAIGPKLAEQAVLVRSNGTVQDLRLPLADGQPIQILTTRDTSDPDALYVLRHSTAHLLAEAVRKLYPGVKVAIGPPVENGFYYDFEFPEPIREDDLERIEAEMLRALDEGRAWEREEISAADARQRFLEENEPYKVELVETADGPISLYTQGEFTDLCRGPHLQDSKPIKAVKLTSLAGAYWRGDEKNTQLTRIYGTAFYSQADLDAHLERLEQARARDHRRLGRPARPLPPPDDHSPGSPFWHPKGMMIYSMLEDLRRRENARRGYLEVKTPLIYDEGARITSGHCEKFRENMFLDPARARTPRDVRDQADELPWAHAALRQLAAQLPRPAAALRRGRAAAPERAGRRPARAVRASATSRRTTRTSSARASRSTRSSTARSTISTYLYGLFGIEPRAELSTRPTTSSAPTRSGTSPKVSSCAALERHEIEYFLGEGEGVVLRAEDRPAHDRRARPLLAAGHDPARRARCRRASGSRTWARDNHEHPLFVIHRALLRLVRALHRHPRRALRRRVPLLARARAGAPDPGRRGPSRRRRRDCASGSRPRAIAIDVDQRDETLGRRIREAELEKIPYVVVYGDRESEGSLAVRERGGGQSTRSLSELLESFAGELARITA